jgi:hypothetical protein
MLKKHFILKHLTLWIALGIVISSCRESGPEKNLAPIHNIFLVGFGMADSRNGLNHGHGADYYIYFDLKKDSVYIRHPKNTGGKEKVARAGRIPNLAQHEVIKDFVQSIQWEKTDNIFLDEDNCNRPFYLQYRKGNDQKTYLYNYATPNPRMLKITRFAVALCQGKKLPKTTKSLNVDSLMHHIQSHDSIPPPRILALCLVPIDTVEFMLRSLSKSALKNAPKESKIYQSRYH